MLEKSAAVSSRPVRNGRGQIRRKAETQSIRSHHLSLTRSARCGEAELPNTQALGFFVMRNQRGGAVIEYFVLAMMAVIATVAFYQTSLSREDTGVRAHIRDAFLSVCQGIAGAPCQ